MSLSDTERAFVELCCEPTLPAPTAVLGAEHAKVWAIYRNMVRHRFLEETKHGLRRTLKLIGAARFDAMFTRFMAAAPPRSRFFYGVVPEFAQFAAPLWQGDASVPPSAADLVRFEAARYSVADMPAPRDRAVVEFDFDRVPVLHDALVLLSLDHAVHRDAATDGGYANIRSEVCIYRGKDECTVGSYALSGFSADCMRAWQGGATVSESVRIVSQARAIQPDAKLIDALCTVLADFLERGVVLGSAPT